jgi:NhaP-type Na+/H+ or K+/H+ antiporter
MAFATWMVIVGLLLIAMAMSGSVLRRLPLSTSMLYVGVGLLIGEGALGLVSFGLFDEALFLERAAEIAVIVSLFSCGLKLKLPIADPQWWLSLRLAIVSMVVTVLLIALAGRYGIGLEWGAAVLLGAILAPTDPVLASDVQVREPGDRDRLRFALTSEAGLNDGTAFPFVMLGLGLLGLHEMGAGGWRWVAVDVLWAVPAGLLVGALLGYATGRAILFLRVRHRTAIGLEEFLTLGLIALSYGLALLLKGYGFLAVFAAAYALQLTASGEALRRQLAEAAPAADGRDDARDADARDGDSGSDDARRERGSGATAAMEPSIDSQDPAVHPEQAPDHMTGQVLTFTEQLERIGEVALVILVGALLWQVDVPAHVWWFVPLLLFVIRPVSVYLGLFDSATRRRQRALIAWFGIRGIGSIYYLYYALNHGLLNPAAELLVETVLIVIACSVVAHGISVTPLMAAYEHRRRRGAATGADAAARR